MTEALLEFFRCPEEFLNLGLTGEMSPRPRPFRFGGEQCYGRSDATGNGAPDLGCTATGSILKLPFNPTEVIENLRRERYIESGGGVSSSELFQSVYYALRPLLVTPVRKRLQRYWFRNRGGLPFPHWPVDVTVERLQRRVLALAMRSRGVEKIPFIWFWPDGLPGCVIMTHDVESAAGVAAIPLLIEIDDSFGLKSSYQLVPGGPYQISTSLLSRIRVRGCEVNLHDLTHSGNLFDNLPSFAGRAQRINHYLRLYAARGFRSGRMYRNLDWYDALDVSYDMSAPNVAHFDPQRGGCCTVFPFFVNRVLELPLTTIQDYALLNILNDFSIELWKRQIEIIAQQNGLASFLVHPDYVMTNSALRVYKLLLAHLAELRSERKVWTALPGEVDRWWRARRRMRIVRRAGGWSIVGDGAQRARLAYASVQDGELVYSVEKEIYPVAEVIPYV